MAYNSIPDGNFLPPIDLTDNSTLELSDISDSTLREPFISLEFDDFAERRSFGGVDPQAHRPKIGNLGSQEKPYIRITRKPLPSQARSNLDCLSVEPGSRGGFDRESINEDHESDELRNNKRNSISNESTAIISQHDVKSKMGGRHSEIYLACAILVIPLAVLAFVLLYLIYKNSLQKPLSPSDQTCSSGLYVDFESTQLVLVASWMSSVASQLSAPVMTLLSFPIARWLVTTSRISDGNGLPSVYQFNILIALIGASIKSVWTSMEYAFAKRRGIASPRAIVICTWFLFAMLILSTMFQLVDTWFHRSTTTVTYVKTTPTNSSLYGRQLSSACKDYYEHYKFGNFEGCLRTTAPYRVPCGFYCPDAAIYPIDLKTGYQLSSSTTTRDKISIIAGNISDGSQQQLAMLMPSEVKSQVEWSANTIGVSTKCQLITSHCIPTLSSGSFPFKCDGSIPAQSYNNTKAVPFQGDAWEESVKGLFQADAMDLPNPYTFGLAAALQGTVDKSYNTKDFIANSGRSRMVILCNTSVHDVSYTSTDGGSNTQINDTRLSNLNISQTINGPMLLTPQVVDAFWQNSLSTAFLSDLSQDSAVESFEEAYSRLTLAFSATNLEPVTSMSESLRNTKLISCVPLIPLWCLLGLVGFYMLLGILLSILALMVSSSNNIRSIQAQLSVAGLTAAAFEPRPSSREIQSITNVNSLFEERPPNFDDKKGNIVHRVGFKMNDGGHWEYDLRTAD